MVRYSIKAPSAAVSARPKSLNPLGEVIPKAFESRSNPIVLSNIDCTKGVAAAPDSAMISSKLGTVFSEIRTSAGASLASSGPRRTTGQGL